MQEVFRQYGAVIVSVIAAILFLTIVAIFFDTNNGELKEIQTEYMDAVAYRYIDFQEGFYL